MDHLKDLAKLFHEFYGWFLWGLVALGIIWVWNGGPLDQSAHEGAYIKPPAPLDNGTIYGHYFAGTTTSQNETLDLPQWPADLIRAAEGVIVDVFRPKPMSDIHSAALAKNGIYIDGIAGAKASDPTREYIRLVLSPEAASPVDITDFVIKSPETGDGFVIPTEGGRDVVLSPGDRALITTGATTTNDFNEKNEKNVFLRQPHEIWQNDADTIELYDARGNLVDALSY